MSPDVLEPARRWAREWERAWREHDVEAVAALYADGASFRSHPFRELQPPGDYAASAFESEEPGADVRFAEPVVVGDGRAAVEWWAVTREEPSGKITLAGVSLLRFDGDGLVVDQRDYWAEGAGRREPYPGWAT
jgi:hypothetical protein